MELWAWSRVGVAPCVCGIVGVARVGVAHRGPAQGRAGRRFPQQGALGQARRRGRNRRAGLEAELQQLDLGSEAAVPSGTGVVSDGQRGAAAGDGSSPAALWLSLQDLLQRCVQVQSRSATDEELLLVHSPEFVAQLDPPDSPTPGPRSSVGSALALLEEILEGKLRNGIALISPQDPPDPTAVAARFAQKHHGVQRVLIVDWSCRAGGRLAEEFREDNSVLYFGCGCAQQDQSAPGCAAGEAFSVRLCWEQAELTDGDFAAAAFHLLLPIAFQFQPQLVLLHTSLHELGGSLGVSPAGFSLLTHLLTALAGGRVMVLLMGVSQAGVSPPGGVRAVLSSLLGEPGEPLGAIGPSCSGLASIARALSVQRQHWSFLHSLDTDEEEEEEEKDEEEEEEEQEAAGEAEEEDEDDEEEDEDDEAAGDGNTTEAHLDVPPEAPGTARVGLVYDQRMEEHRNTWDSQHPESPQRLSRALQRLQELRLAQSCIRVTARAATARELRAVHTRSHIRALSRGALLSPRELRALAESYNSVYLCQRSYRCARLAAGGACEAVRAVMAGKVRSCLALLRPPGHHAGRSSAGGFCLFNNAAVAARHAQGMAGGRLRVLILDWDVHHGNGTQEIFEEDPSVLYISLHRHDGSFFPGGSCGSPRRTGRGAGRGFTLNVGWAAPRVGDADYLMALSRLVLPVACQFGPELILVSAGFDAGRGDPLGGCLLSPQTFGLFTHLLGALAGGRMVLLLEGGYNLSVTAEGVGHCLGVLLGSPPALPPPGSPQPTSLRALGGTVRAQRGFWSCLRLPRVDLPKEKPGDDVTPNPGDVTPAADRVTANPDDVTASLDSAIGRLGALKLGEAAVGVAKAKGAGLGGDHAHVGGASAAACWEEEEELEEGALFAVTPLPHCPHLGSVAPPPPAGTLGDILPPPCGVCGSRRENWLCLSCHQVLCGRYMEAHMLQHGESSGHPLVLSLRDLAAWCYPCGGYVSNPVLLPTKSLIYRLKFGTDPPSPSL